MSELDALTSYISSWGGRDLHATDMGEFRVAGWDGFPVRRYRYTKTDPDGTAKVGEVALLDADDLQIARWVYSAVKAVAGAYDRNKAHKLVNECGNASGFQFPVRGIHWEEMPSPIFAAYTFFDGVTIRLKGWSPSWPTEKLAANQIDSALNATWSDVDEAMRYARIQSTSRKDYHDNGGALSTDGKEWLNVVRQCYQQAWNSDTNELMTAKARAIL